MSLQRPLHRYDPLPESSIRLLRLLPHQDEDAPIQCQIFNCSLENSRGTRPYEALSYVWGSNHGSHSISIDKCYLPIGDNLFVALLHLRDPCIERILWIDAVCINQKDNREKGHQVQAMAKIYAKATRVIVWLGRTIPDIDQALEDIRIAGFTEKETEPATNGNAILKILEAPWFRRVWVLQEVAAARHIVVKCGPAEIDGYAFFSGITSLKLPYEDYPGLQLLVLSIAYLAKGAAFRSRYTTSQTGRFSLDICHIGQLMDMYHNHQASDIRDRIYALLGMSSDDPGTSGLLVDYDISWAKLFKQLVHSILGSVPVDTWDGKAVAVIKGKGCVLGRVTSASADIGRNGKQQLRVQWYRSPEELQRLAYCWELEVSAELVQQDDVICFLQGATFPTIIRIHHDYWDIVVIAANFLKQPKAAIIPRGSEFPSLPISFPYDLLLVWDWDLRLDDSQRGSEYKDLMGRLVPKARYARLQTDCEKITRLWNAGVAMPQGKRSSGEEILRKAIEIIECVLRNIDSLLLADLGRGHQMMGDDMRKLQGIVDLISMSKGRWVPLCLAAEVGCEAVARLLLDIGQVDPNAPGNWDETPLSKAAKNGHEGIVKLLLNNEKVNPDARADSRQPTPLGRAAQSGHEAIVKLLINTGKVDVNAVDCEMTPLMYAAFEGHTAIVALLLSTSGVEPDFGFHPEGTEDTALSLAVRRGHEEIVELLLGVSQIPLDLEYTHRVYLEPPTLTLLSLAKREEHRGIIKLLERAMELETARKNKGKES